MFYLQSGLHLETVMEFFGVSFSKRKNPQKIISWDAWSGEENCVVLPSDENPQVDWLEILSEKNGLIKILPNSNLLKETIEVPAKFYNIKTKKGKRAIAFISVFSSCCGKPKKQQKYFCQIISTFSSMFVFALLKH